MMMSNPLMNAIKLLGYCKEFERYLKTTKDDPTKWHLKFAKCFEPYLRKDPNSTRATKELHRILDELAKANKTSCLKVKQITEDYCAISG